MRFVSKQTKVNAERFFSGVPPAPTGVHYSTAHGLPEFYCITPTGMVQVKDGDWIIEDPFDGHHYPMRPAVFHALYDPLGI
jgi:hypothetical protein